MKFAALILFLLFGILTVQPAITNLRFGIDPGGSSCIARCKKSIKEKPVKKDNCENRRCNPIMSCIYGNFFLPASSEFTLAKLKLSAVKISVMNDNRVVSKESDCWHPPKYVPA